MFSVRKSTLVSVACVKRLNQLTPFFFERNYSNRESEKGNTGYQIPGGQQC